MSGKNMSFEDESEQSGASHVQTDPIHMDPYQQPTWEQIPFPSAAASNFTDNFSQSQVTGEKLVPQSSPSGMSTFMKLIPPACIFLLLLFALLGGGHVFNDIISSRTVPSQQVQINQSAHVVIQDDYGQVHIHGSNVSSIAVRSTQFGTGVGIQSDATSVDTRVVDDGNVVLINALRSDGTSFSDDQRVDLDVTVPAQVALQVLAPQGAVAVDGVSGSLHIEARDSINAQHVSGTRGAIVFKSQTGSIDAAHVSGQVNFSALQGSITIRDGHLLGRSRMRTDTAKLAFSGDFDPDGAYSFETQSGMIEITLPQLTSFDLHLFADQNLITNEFEDALMGPPPRAQLGIATQNGYVEINQEH